MPWSSGDSLNSTNLNNTSGLIFNVLDPDYSADSSGAADSTASILAALSAATAAGGGVVLIPEGTYRLDGNLNVVGSDGISIVGQGWKSILSRAANSTYILSVETCSAVVVRDLAFDMNGSLGDTARRALRFQGCDDIIVDNCLFSNAVEEAIRLNSGPGSSTTTATRAIISNSKFSSSVNSGADGSDADIYARGGWDFLRFRDNQHVSHVTNGIPIGIFVVRDDSAHTYSDVVIDGCSFTSLNRGGIFFTDENPDGVPNGSRVMISKCNVKDCRQEGVKLKNAQRAIVTDSYFENNDQDPESSSLRGAVFFNATEEAIASNNIFIDNGTHAIRTEGLSDANSGTTLGVGRSRHVFSSNVVDNCGSDDIYISQLAYETSVANNVLSNSGGIGIRLEGDSKDTSHPRNVTITGNTIRRCTSHGMSLSSTFNATITGNVIDEGTIHGIQLQRRSEHVVVANNVITDNDTDGIIISNCSDVLITGNRIGNREDGTRQRYGINIGNNNNRLVIASNNLNDNATGAVNGTMPGNSIARDNIDWLSAGSTVDWASLADAASATTIFDITGAAIGDHVEVFPGVDLAGLVATGYVNASNQATAVINNNTGGAVDLASSRWTMRVNKG